MKATLAAIGTKKKKKTYKKSKSKDGQEVLHDEDIAVSIKVPEFSSVDEL